MTTPQPTSTPDDLQARLRAAGVTDNASLHAALERDPQLKADFEAYLASPEYQAELMRALLAAFVAVGDPEQLREFWREVPAELEQPLIEIVEAHIAASEISGRSALSAPTAETAETAEIESLRAKLADFKRMCDEAEQVRRAESDIQNLPPVQRAVVAFCQAPDEAAARAWFASQGALLQPFEAQQALDALAAQTPDDAPAEVKQRLAERAALLRQLRGADAQPAPAASQPENLQSATFDNRQMQIGGNLYQAQEININNVYELQWRWVRPKPSNLPKDLVERAADIEAVVKKIRAQGVVAISGVKGASGPAALTMQGMAGVGKTSLARLLAKRLDAEYSDGVLWTDVGPGVQKREDAAAILKTWAGFYVGGIEDKALAFTPEAVRALMAEHPNVLVILDNVWSLDAIKPLREALPPGTHHILTTRSLEIMRHAGGATHEVGLLGDADALALVELRLKWRPEDNSADVAWVGDLIARLGHHPLALDIALGLMNSEGLEPAEWRETAQRVVNQVRSGSNFGDLKLPVEIDRDANVEAALLVSYEFLDAAAQARLRQLGALAPEAGFSAAQAAAIWQCEEAEARGQLMALFNRSLLERRSGHPREGGDSAWGQHAILRGYALALLRREGEYEAAAARHAQAYDDAMRAADGAQRYHELLPTYDQLAHAFEWAVENDLDRALSLIGNCFNLQAQWGKIPDNLSWSQRALTAAQTRGTPADVARAQGSLANAMSRAAALPGEDRRARLLEALAAYDTALQHYRPDTAPLAYAATQNNRAVLLRDLAGLPGEDRRARLLEALSAYDAALQFRRPDTAPLAYAMTQNNRAVLLSDLAGLPGEDQRARLLEALSAYDAALQHYRPDTAPLDYAMTQNNRANLLRDLAGLPGEDRHARLLDALAACDAALQFRRPDTAPLDYAATQNNRGLLLNDLASLPGEDRRARLLEALAAYDAALQFCRPDTAPLAYAGTQNNRAVLLSDLATVPGEDRRARLLEALQCAVVAVALFEQYQQAQYLEVGKRVLKNLREACGADFAAFWAQADLGQPPDWLMRDESEQQPDPLQAALAAYLEQHERAANAENDPAAWQRAADAGEGLLSLLGAAGAAGEGVDELKADIASAYNSLGNALDESDKRAALDAFERAIALQPGFAMWHRNRAGTLIELGELDEAAAAIARARELEPDAPRLAELDAQLAQAREAQARG